MIKTIKVNYSQLLFLLISFTLLCFITACGGSKDGDTGTDPGTTTTAASLTISASQATVSSNNTDSTTLTVTAIDSSSALVPNIAINITSDNGGVLGAATITTDATGKATVTFAAGTNATNRTANITATAGTVSTFIPIQVVGSTVSLESDTTSLTNNASTEVNLTVTARNSTPIGVLGANVTLTATSGGDVTIVPPSGTTNSSGKFTAKVTGGPASGPVIITASALGATAAIDLTVTAVADTFNIDQQTLNAAVIANETTTAMKIGDTLNIRIHAPVGVDNVTFVTSIGAWDGGSSKSVTKAVVGQSANATLRTTQAGVAGVQVYNQAHPATSDTLTVAMSSGAAPYSIQLQAAPTNVPVSVGTTTGSSTLTATVRDSSNNPIGGVPVAFSIVNPTSGGETVLPVVVTTAETTTTALALGQAHATFTSGSITSGSDGIQIRAAVVGATYDYDGGGPNPALPVETEPVLINLTPNGNDASIVIGGVAGSISFGQATVIKELDASDYSFPMSVLVADSAGAAVSGAVVSLSIFPIAWSTGVAAPCAYDADNGTTQGTFWNEDLNENISLDADEDGARYYYSDKTKSVLIPNGTLDTFLTPKNSDGGTVPSTVTTDSNGVATFNLNYGKQHAIWTMVRLRASTKVSNTETRSEIIFRLPCSDNDCGSTCRLGNSPYTF